MKKALTILFLCFLNIITISAQFQAEKGFSFQGYARDFGGASLGDQTIVVRFTIYPQGGNAEYQEEQTVTTDAYGVFATVIGQERVSEFKKLDFSTKNYWLKVETKANNSDFATISETELLAVPYAKAASTAANGVPAGTILPFGGPSTNIPTGYLPCDGREISSSEYPALYAAISTAWGEGTGSNFRLPDLRGYFLRGVDNGRGADPEAASRTARNNGNSGDNVGSLQNDEVGAHSHTGTAEEAGEHQHDLPEPVVNYKSGTNSNTNGGDGESRPISATEPAGKHTHNLNIDNSTGKESRPKNAYVWFMIKY